MGGFGLRCRASGARSWYVQYRTKSGEMRKHTLGNPGTVSFAKAFKSAEQLLAAAKLGGDPAAEAKKAKGALKLEELIARYLEHQKPRVKGRSYTELERHLRTYFDGKEGKEDKAPLREHRSLLKQAAGGVTQRQIVELLQRLGQTAPIAANRTRASLSAMFSWGMKAGLVPSNPVAATFKPGEEKPRERVLADAELALIWACIGGTGDYDRIVRLLMLTGARREEIAGMRWSEITMNEVGTATWVLPSGRSKNRLPHELALPPMAVTLLPSPREDENGTPREFMFGEVEGPFSGWSRCKERL
ncbi:MAG: tyrosine-type recombinase/integrase, partial [Acetobacteraceae bacterium]